MRYALASLVLLASLALTQAQDPAMPKPQAPAVAAKLAKRTLPTGWNKLKLTTAQKQAVYVIQDAYKAKIVQAQAQVDAIKQQQYADSFRVLTPDQVKLLQDLVIVTSESKAAP